MSKERQLIDFINNLYRNFENNGTVLTPDQKMIFETGIAQGIKFAVTQIADINLTVLGQYSPEDC